MICRVLAAVGLVIVLVTVTPLDIWWAHAYAGSIDQPKATVLVLLSAARDDNGFISYSSYWRARYALLAWHTGSFKTLVVVGEGSGAIGEFLVAEGIPPAAIIRESRSVSTRQNAENVAQLLRSLPGTKVLLTSDYHMFRARRAFMKLGVEVIPYPAPDVMKSGQNWRGRLLGFQTLLLETTKIVDYRLHGWI